MPPNDDPAGDCLARRWLDARPEARAQAWPEGFAAGLAHRLDTPTSGAVAAAVDADELDALRRAFQQHQLLKTYRFLSWSHVPWREHRCDRAIAHAPRHKKRVVVQRGADTPHRGRWLPAETTFRHLGGHLWEATMRSGVMHQIRAHAAFVGLPLAGDPLYGRGPSPELGAPFCLHHVGFRGAGWSTEDVPTPPWATGP